MDLLDPGCVRLLLERRVRLSPVRWAALPGLIGYEAHLQVRLDVCLLPLQTERLHSRDVHACLLASGASVTCVLAPWLPVPL